MILIQDGSQNTNVDKPLRIIGDPYKVQVSVQTRRHCPACPEAFPATALWPLAFLQHCVVSSTGMWRTLAGARKWVLRRHACLCLLLSVVCSQQACEMVMDILRERDQGGFGDRNEYGSRVGGGIDVSAGTPGRWAAESREHTG